LEQADHVNHNRADNAWVNLREVTPTSNQRNQTLSKNNTSEVLGVSWSAACQKWRAYITVGHKQKHLGVFACKLEATLVRAHASRDLGFHANHGKPA
jgi:hypothetical protein